MGDRLHHKVALVTGAAGGIGRAVAQRLAQEGARVAVNDIRAGEALDETVGLCRAACGAEDGAIAVPCDVADEAQVAETVARVIERFGRLDVLVNNAGILVESPSHEVAMSDYDRVVEVNLRGAFLCARAAIAHFLERGGGGVVLNNSSCHQAIPKPGFVSYSISKGGLENLTRTLALEYAHEGIRVNAVAPGAVDSPMNASWIGDQQARAAVERRIPVGRVAAPEEIAAVFAFLASEDASYITGQTIFACGGLTLYQEFRENWTS